MQSHTVRLGMGKGHCRGRCRVSSHGGTCYFCQTLTAGLSMPPWVRLRKQYCPNRFGWPCRGSAATEQRRSQRNPLLSFTFLPACQIADSLTERDQAKPVNWQQEHERSRRIGMGYAHSRRNRLSFDFLESYRSFCGKVQSITLLLIAEHL